MCGLHLTSSPSLHRASRPTEDDGIHYHELLIWQPHQKLRLGFFILWNTALVYYRRVIRKHQSASKCIMGWWVPLSSGCPRNRQKGTCGVDCSQRVQAVTDYICPVAVCNEQGEGGVKERKRVYFQANQNKATDEKKSQNESRAATKNRFCIL